MKIRKLLTAATAATTLTVGMASPAFAAETPNTIVVAQDHSTESVLNLTKDPVWGSIAMPVLVGFLLVYNIITLIFPGTGCSLLNASGNCSAR